MKKILIKHFKCVKTITEYKMMTTLDFNGTV